MPHRSSPAGYALNEFMRYPTRLVLPSYQPDDFQGLSIDEGGWKI